MDEIYQNLLKVCPAEKIYSFESEIYCSFISDIQEYKLYLINNWDRIVALYQKLNDDLSRKTLEAFLKGRVSAEQRFFINIMMPEQYYPSDIIQFNENEVMVELGTNDGKTLIEFLNRVNHRYKKVYCFEPDKECVLKLESIISQETGNIEIIKRGAWNKTTVLSFYIDSEHGASRIVENNMITEESILVDTVDNCVDAQVTYMKMDIEGSELKALQGSEKIILRCRPKLAICVYHNKEDLLDIVDYLKELVPGYKFYLRHHNWGATETVLYAI